MAFGVGSEPVSNQELTDIAQFPSQVSSRQVKPGLVALALAKYLRNLGRVPELVTSDRDFISKGTYQKSSSKGHFTY